MKIFNLFFKSKARMKTNLNSKPFCVCEHDTIIVSNDMQKLLTKLFSLKKECLEVCNKNFKACDGKFFYIDFLSMAVLNRAISNIEGYSTMIQKDNYYLLNSILRLQLDTMLRFFSLNISNNPFDTAKKILSGERLDKIKDKDNKKMLDKYLCESFEKYENVNWVKRVYDATSGFIHLSKKHILCCFTDKRELDDNGFLHTGIVIGERSGINIPEEIKIESTECMICVTEILLKYVKKWNSYKESLNA
ncbi:MAG: hypothetical protein K2Q14_00940 [Gammaproteobacteria bacterium]|nr:hypothetical protein [Gammaproteobacteria bacterium]